MSIHFFPYLRVGAASEITTDGSATGPARITRSVTSASASESHTDEVTLSLLGPGEIATLSPKVVRSCWPRNNDADVETNFFVRLEFHEPDLPWRFTPAMPQRDRLPPWLALIVVDADAHTFVTPRSGCPNSRVTIPAGVKLPDLAQSWAWAHVQSSVDDPQNHLDDPDVQVIARLLCPMRLQARTRYRALLVPTYARGVEAGLSSSPDAAIVEPSHSRRAWGRERGDETADGACTLAAPLELPVFFEWTFTTGEAEDFESLASALVPASTEERAKLGSVAVRADIPLQSSSTGEFMMCGALGLPGVSSETAVVGQAALLDALGVDAGEQVGPDPLVKPPLYGQRHLMLDKLEIQSPPARPRPWFRQINTDLRWRSAAGLGAEIVRAEQRDLLDSAWDQYKGGLREENQRRRRELSHTLRKRGEERFKLTEALVTVAPTDSNEERRRKRARELRHATTTIPVARLDAGDVPTGLRDPQLRRLRSGSSRLAQRLGLDAEGHQTGPTPTGGFGGVIGVVPRGVPSGVADLGVPRPPASLPAPVTAKVGAAIASKIQAHLETRVAALDTRRSELTAKLRDAVLQPSPPPPKPQLAAPVFDDFPLVEVLQRIAPELLLPGLSSAPMDRAIALQENRPFLEALCVGASVEMARELQWHEFPTDLRGTHFRRVWRPIEPSAPHDVVPDITQWTGGLGSHSDVGVPEGRLVLLLRARLIRKYPNPIVYLAQWIDGNWGPTQLPTFGGFPTPETAFYGFDLSIDAARDRGNGWHFILCEAPTGMRFGLDLPPAPGEALPGLADGGRPIWGALCWGHTGGEFVNVDRNPDLNLTWALTQAGSPTAADLAAVTQQQTAAVGIPAADLLQEGA